VIGLVIEAKVRDRALVIVLPDGAEFCRRLAMLGLNAILASPRVCQQRRGAPPVAERPHRGRTRDTSGKRQPRSLFESGNLHALVTCDTILVLG
jgi:hypothetical protein